MDEAAIINYIQTALDGVDSVVSDGNTFFFYDPGKDLPSDHRFPFATLVANDAYDQVSALSRPMVFRLNVGVSKQTYQSMFGTGRAPTAKDGTHDFTALDSIMPHPVYGKMYWVCVLSPSDETFEQVRPMLAEAHATAAESYKRRPQSK